MAKTPWTHVVAIWRDGKPIAGIHVTSHAEAREVARKARERGCKTRITALPTAKGDGYPTRDDVKRMVAASRRKGV